MKINGYGVAGFLSGCTITGGNEPPTGTIVALLKDLWRAQRLMYEPRQADILSRNRNRRYTITLSALQIAVPSAPKRFDLGQLCVGFGRCRHHRFCPRILTPVEETGGEDAVWVRLPTAYADCRYSFFVHRNIV